MQSEIVKTPMQIYVSHLDTISVHYASGKNVYFLIILLLALTVKL